MPEDKDKPKPQLPKPGNKPPHTKDSSVKEYGDGACTIDVETPKD